MKGASYSIRVMKTAKKFNKEHEQPAQCPGQSQSVSSDKTSETSSCKATRLIQPGHLPPGRGAVKCIKRVKGKRGGPDRIELIVNIDLSVHNLDDEKIAQFKEVFQLFDKDEDGVLSFHELNVVMKSLGQRPTEKKLLRMVRSVTKDKMNFTIEFNEFLQMMSKQQEEKVEQDELVEAFKMFDRDGDGFLSVSDLKRIMTSLGEEKLSKKDVEMMVKEADSDNDGLVNCKEFCTILCTVGPVKNGKSTSRSNTSKLSEKKEHSSKTSSIATISG